MSKFALFEIILSSRDQKRDHLLFCFFLFLSPSGGRFLLIVNLRLRISYLRRFPTHIAVIRYSELLFSARAVVLYYILARSRFFDFFS